MGLKRGTVMLNDFSDEWKNIYLQEEKLLKKLLKKYILEIEHVGSTSIEGIKAKPIIDILIVIESLNKIPDIEKILVAYGYYNRGSQGVEDRCFFAKGDEDKRTHYIHFTTPKSKTYYNLLYFKKYLLKYPEYVDKYCEVKSKLARKYSNDRKMYTAGKAEFIADVIEKAKREFDD